MKNIEQIIQNLKPYTSKAYKWEILWKEDLDVNFRACLQQEILKEKDCIDEEKKYDWRREAQMP